MKYMELYNLIIENISRVDLKNKYNDIPDKEYNEIISLDPTSTDKEVGKYSTWLLRLYRQNKLDVKDSEISDLLSTFDKKSKTLKRGKILKYNNIDDLKTGLGVIKEPEEKDPSKNLGSKILYKDKDWIIETPVSYEQSCKAYGKTTSWCTASVDYGSEYYEDYHNGETADNIYVLRHPNSAKPVAQIAIKNKDIVETQIPRERKPYDITSLFKNYPKIKEFFEKLAPDYFELIKNTININGKRIKYKIKDGIRVFKNININDENLDKIPDFATL